MHDGRWWNNDSEIDIIGINGENKRIIFCECKWSNKDIGTNILNDLMEKAKKVDWNNNKRKESFALFSKSGYTEELMKVAKERGDVFLFLQDKLILSP